MTELKLKLEILRRSNGRGNNVDRISGFPDRETLVEWAQNYKDKWFVYFPRFSNIRQDEDGTWSVERSEAGSCD